MLNRKVALKIAFNSFLGLVLIFVWSRFVNLKDLLEVLKTVDIRYALVFFLLFAFSGLIRGLRLKLLLKTHNLPWKDLTLLHFLSQFLSFLIPVRAGEIAKGVYFTSRLKAPLSKTMVWVLIDRFLDFWVAILFIGTLLPFIKTNLPDKFRGISLIALVILTLVLLIAIKSEKWIKKIATFSSHFLVVESIKRWFVTFTHNIAEGFEILRRSPLELVILIGLTMLATVIDSLVWLFTFQAFGFQLGIVKSVWADSLTALTFLIPSAPGYVGSAEAAGSAVFSGALGLPINLTSATSVFYHLLTLVAILILGIAALYILKFDLGSVWKKLRSKE